MQNTNKTNQLICAHSGLVFAALMGLGIFVIAGWLPVIEPGMTAAGLAARFVQDQMRIRIGMMFLVTASALWWSFSAVISTQMKRIEGPHHPLTYAQIGSAAGTALAVMVPAFLWLAMDYRPGNVAPDTLQLINDFNWMVFIGAFPPAVVQNLAVGLCILSDRSGRDIYPRWVGYANVWLAISFLPGALIPFFKSGPFAWNGIIGFWVAALAFFGWVVIMWWATLRAIKHQVD